MATYEALRQAIDTLIKANGNKEITGDILNNVLNTMLTALSANYQFCGEAKPNTAPGQPLQNVFYFAYEAGTYVNFGGIILPLGISMLKWDGTAWTGENIYTFDAQPLLNSSNLISSGAVYNALIELSDAMHSGKLFAGIADPSTTPDGLTNGQPIFYLAVEKGTYSHFLVNGDIPLVLEKDGIWILTSGADDDDWNAVCLIEIDDTPNPLSKELISSKAVYNAIRLFGESFGFGKLYNGIATPTTTPDPLQGRRMFYLATQAGTYEHFFANGDIPLVLPHDGLYAIYSVTGADDDDWNWEQILQFDDEVISNSHNLPTSMAVYNTLEAFKAEVNALIQEINPTVIEGNVTNAPDEEDLTSVNERLKFKNKEYNSLSASGLGRVYLRKNWVDGVNTLTQAMINESNTIYHIQYDYVLGENITVPAGCVLEFDGGSLSGAHTLTGQNTGIEAGLVKILNTDVILAGTWNVAEAYPEWFGAVCDGVVDDTAALLKSCVFKHITIINNIFIKDTTISNVIIKNKASIFTNKTLLLENVELSGGKVFGNGDGEPIYPTIALKGGCISNVVFDGTTRSQVFINTISSENRIINCRFKPVARFDILESSQDHTVIDGCIFESHESISSYDNSVGIKCSNTSFGYEDEAAGQNDVNNGSSANTIITNCYFGSHWDNCIDGFEGIRDSIIESCLFVNNLGSAIELKNGYKANPNGSGTSLPNNRYSSNIKISNTIINAPNHDALQLKNNTDTVGSSIPFIDMVCENVYFKGKVLIYEIDTESIIKSYFYNCQFENNKNDQSCVQVQTYNVNNMQYFKGCSFKSTGYGIYCYGGGSTFDECEFDVSNYLIYERQLDYNSYVYLNGCNIEASQLIVSENRNTNYYSINNCKVHTTLRSMVAKCSVDFNNSILESDNDSGIVYNLKASNSTFNKGFTYSGDVSLFNYTFMNVRFGKKPYADNAPNTIYYAFGCYITDTINDANLLKCQGCSLNSSQSGDVSSNYKRN